MTRWLRWLGVMTVAGLLTTFVATPSEAATARGISLSAPASATTGAMITVRGTLTHSVIGSLVIIRRKSGTSWVQVAAARTQTSAGAYVQWFRVSTRRGTYYFDAYAPKTSRSLAATSAAHAVVVRTRVKVSLAVSNTKPIDGTAVTLAGAIAPWVAGTAVSLQRRVGSATIWSTLAWLSPNAGGRFAKTTVPVKDAVNYYRVIVRQRGYYTRAISPSVAVTAHTSVPPPDPVAGFSAAPHTPGAGVDLNWGTIPGTDPNNPSDPSNKQTLVIRRAPGVVAPPTPTSGSAVATLGATQTSHEDTNGLTAGARYSYSIFLEDLSGHFSNPSSVSVVAPNPPTGVNWGPITNPVPYAGTARFLQCPTADFCMLIGAMSYQTWSAGSWSGPQPLPYQLDGNMKLSCASANMCIIADWQNYSVFNGQTWSVPSSLVSTVLFNNVFESVACPTPTFCLATTFNGGSVRWDGASWSTAPDFGTSGSGYTDSIHCASATLCWAEGGAHWNGTSWSPIEQGSSASGLDHMSCPSISFCVDVGYYGAMSAYDGQRWSQMTSPWPAMGELVSATDVACTSSTFCISVAQSNGSGYSTLISTFDGASWSTPVTFHPRIAADPLVACPSASLCFEVDSSDAHADEEIASLQNGAWTTPTLVTQANHMSGVSCVQNGVCRSVDFAGNVRTYEGSAWSTPTLVDPASGATNISCGTTTFCAVVDDGGGVVIERNGLWGPRQVLAPGVGLTYVSCTSDEACMALAGDGTAEQFKGGQWTNVTSPAFSFVGPVACGSMNYCVSLGYWWNGSTWLRMPSTNGTFYTTATCITTSDCLIAFGGNFGSKPTAAHFVNGAWAGTPIPIGAPDYLMGQGAAAASVACVSASLCVAIGDGLDTFSPGGVTAGPYVPIDDSVYSISCSSATLCVAVGGDNVLVSH